MVEDGSFEQDFVPKYNKAVENSQPYFTYAGTTVPIYQAKAMVELGSKAIGNKQRINFIKDLLSNKLKNISHLTSKEVACFIFTIVYIISKIKGSIIKTNPIYDKVV